MVKSLERRLDFLRSIKKDKRDKKGKSKNLLRKIMHQNILNY